MPIVELERDGSALEVSPSDGAGILSLVLGGREWLADGRRPRAEVPGNLRGWDECLPNIATGRHPSTGAELADHGELWSQNWDVVHASESVVETAASGVSFPFRLRRRLELRTDGVDVDYRLHNVGDEAWPFNWAMHLLLAIDPTRIAFPGETPVRVDGVIGGAGSTLVPLVGAGWLPWSDLCAALPFGETGWGCKFFVQPGAVSFVDVCSGRLRLRVETSSEVAPSTFGIWINEDAFGTNPPQRHVGIEPGFGDTDSLEQSVARGTSAVVEAGQNATWSVRIRIVDNPMGSAEG